MIDRRANRPFPIQGSVGSVVYAVANYEDRYGGHVFRIALSVFAKNGPHLMAGARRPMCGFYVRDVEMPEAQIAPVVTVEVAPEAMEADRGDSDPCKWEGYSSRPTVIFSGFIPREVEGDGLEDLPHRRLYPIAKDEGVPRYSSITKPAELREAIRAHRREKASPAPDSACHSAPSPSSQTAA